VSLGSIFVFNVLTISNNRENSVTCLFHGTAFLVNYQVSNKGVQSFNCDYTTG